MGFLDKAKGKLAGIYNSVSEETVRKVNYETNEEIFDEEPKEKPKPEKIKAPAKPKVERSPIDLKAKLSSIVKTEKPEKPKEEVKPKEDKKNEESTQAVKDVLEVLNISETFQLPANVFLPEDLDNVKFDLQVPKGYDIGQVNAFIEQVIATTKHYVKLLKIRNGDIAKLATTVDRLEVDLNNVKFDAELSQGINIMPTDSEENIESENIGLKLENRRLKELIESFELNENNEISEEKQSEFDELQDKLSLEKIENQNLKKTIYDLKNRVAYLEEAADSTMETVSDYSEVNVDENEWDANSQNYIPSFTDTFGQGLNPNDENSDDSDLPDVDLNDSNYTQSESNAYEDFYAQDDENDAFASVKSDPVQDLFNQTPRNFESYEEEEDDGEFNFESSNDKLSELYESENSNTDFLSDIMSDTWNEKGN